jgi:lambda family phage tail tape measure protein
MSDLAKLVVSMEANIAKFTTDMNRAASVAEEAMKRVQDVSAMAANVVKTAFVGMAAAYTVDSFKSGIDGAIKSAAELHNLAEKTGATVEALSGLKSVAGMSGTSLDTVGMGLQKLSKSMYESAAGNQEMQDQFRALGVSVKDSNGSLRDGSDVMMDVAKRFAEMDNGAQKVALAQKLFGKSGSELLPVLRDMAEVGELDAKVTSAMGFEAEKLEIGLFRLQNQKKALYNTIAQQILPVYRDFVDMLMQTGGQAAAMNDKAKELAKDNKIREWAQDAAMGAAHLMDVFGGVVRVIKVVGSAIAAVFADVMSVVDFFGSIDGHMNDFSYISKAWDKTLGEMKSHAKSFGDDFEKILTEKTNAQRLADEFAKRDAGLKSGEKKPHGPRVDIPGRKAAVEAYKSFLDELDRMATKTEENEYAMLRLKTAQMAEKAAITDTAAALDKINKIQRADSQKAIDMLAEKMGEENRLMAEQNDLLILDARSQELATAALKRRHEMEQAIIAAKRSGKPLDDQAIADLAKNTQAQIEAAQSIIKSRQDTERSFNYGATKAFQTYLDDATNAAKQAQNLFTNAFKSMEDALVKFVQTGKLDFKSMADSIIADLIRIQIQRNITAPLVQSMSGAAMGDGGLFASLGKFMGFRAAGGPIQPGGTYMVGEKGPELFTSSTGGSIIPNHALPAISGGGSGIQVNVINSVANDVQANVSQRSGPDGTVLDVQITRIQRAIAADINKGRGPISNAIAGQFGLNRAVGAV